VKAPDERGDDEGEESARATRRTYTRNLQLRPRSSDNNTRLPWFVRDAWVGYLAKTLINATPSLPHKSRPWAQAQCAQ
jgi:hypothetical protein